MASKEGTFTPFHCPSNHLECKFRGQGVTTKRVNRNYARTLLRSACNVFQTCTECSIMFSLYSATLVNLRLLHVLSQLILLYFNSITLLQLLSLLTVFVKKNKRKQRKMRTERTYFFKMHSSRSFSFELKKKKLSRREEKRDQRPKRKKACFTRSDVPTPFLLPRILQSSGTNFLTLNFPHW